ncbi:unnamed protein product [Pleuronectes platessa]|uniref:Uncharacterized protein n=1 Tax=Pleuronectes platessa TaxID=8262 RepID=A0A9N7V6H8_PLEPL|nr:unnamed protein product [Pleuronectes platessa]
MSVKGGGGVVRTWRMCVCVCGGGLCEQARWEEKGRGRGIERSISHRPTAAVFSAEGEREGGLRGVRQCVCSVFSHQFPASAFCLRFSALCPPLLFPASISASPRSGEKEGRAESEAASSPPARPAGGGC